jgi:protein-disulfide isomerase
MLTAGSSQAVNYDLATWIPDYSITFGNKEAKLKYVYFFDYQCPACKANDTNVEQVYEKYKDQVEFVFRNFPLNIHPYSKYAARAGITVSKLAPTKFLEYKKEIFAKQADMEPKVIDEIAKKFVPDFAEYTKEKNSTVVENQILQDLNFIQNKVLVPELTKKDVKATSTPTTILVKDNKDVAWFAGARDLEGQSKIIDEYLAK